MFKNSTATEKLNRYVRDSGGDFDKAVLHGVSPNRLYELSLLEKIAGVVDEPATKHLTRVQHNDIEFVAAPKTTPNKKAKSKRDKS